MQGFFRLYASVIQDMYYSPPFTDNDMCYATPYPLSQCILAVGKSVILISISS